MMTYRVGAAGAPSAALAMASYLREQTLPAAQASLAAYYQRGMSPDFRGELGTDNIALIGERLVEAGVAHADLIEALPREIVQIHDDFVAGYFSDDASPKISEAETFVRIAEWYAASQYTDDPIPLAFVDHHLLRELEARAFELRHMLGQAEQHGLMSRIDDVAVWQIELAANAREQRRMFEAFVAAEQAASYRLDVVLDCAERCIEGRTAAEPRRDMHPAVSNALGLSAYRSPSRDEIANILNGQRADGADITGKQKQRATANKGRVGYIDFTFSADKSVSVAWALAPTEAERNLIASAHRDAVAGAMIHVAAELGHVRLGHAGRGGTEAGHMGWLSFDHYTSRPTVSIARTDAAGEAYTELASLKVAGDMALHTHVTVPNIVVTDSGRVGAMDLDLIRGRVHEFGGYYQALLSANLQRHGIEIDLDQRTGAAKVRALPDSMRVLFSKRTQDGTKAAQEFAAGQGLDWDALSPERRSALVKQGTQHHGKLSKQDRAEVAGDGELASWHAQARAAGYVHRSVLRPDAIPTQLTRDARLEAAFHSSLPVFDMALQRQARMSRQELRVAAVRGLVVPGASSPDEIGAITRAYATRGVQQDGRATALVWGIDPTVRGKEQIGITTALHESQEARLVELVRAASANHGTALTSMSIEAAIRARELLPLEDGGLRFDSEHGREQRAIIPKLGEGGQLTVAIGVAGAGKSALLAPLIDAWKADGRQVYGTALSWKQAHDLQGAGVDKSARFAFDVLLRRADRGKISLDAKSVVVVDELGVIGTRQMLELLELQAEHGFQIVAVGDPKQTQAIEAGPVIALMRRALGDDAIPELLTTQRQRSALDRQTTAQFREGNAEAALQTKRADGTAQLVAGGRAEAIARVASLWRSRMDTNAHDPAFKLTVSAPTNQDARDIGAAIREQRRAMGLLGEDLKTFVAHDQAGTRYDLTLAVGDRVRLYQQARASFTTSRAGTIGSNGSVLEVRGVHDAGLVLRNEHGSEGLVLWRGLQDRETGQLRLSYGDVLTINALQGDTSTETIAAIISGSAAIDGFKAYPAASRHREVAWMVFSDGAERREVARRRPLGDARPISEQDVWANVARNLSRQPEKSSALAFLERAQQVRRGAVMNLQVGLQRVEAARMAGPHETVADRSYSQRYHNRAAAAVAQTADVQRSVFREAVARAAAWMEPVIARARHVLGRGQEPQRQRAARM